MIYFITRSHKMAIIICGKNAKDISFITKIGKMVKIVNFAQLMQKAYIL